MIRMKHTVFACAAALSALTALSGCSSLPDPNVETETPALLAQSEWDLTRALERHEDLVLSETADPELFETQR